MWFFWTVSSWISTRTPLVPKSEDLSWVWSWSCWVVLMLGVGLGSDEVDAIMAFNSKMSPDMTSHKPFSDKLTAWVVFPGWWLAAWSWKTFQNWISCAHHILELAPLCLVKGRCVQKHKHPQCIIKDFNFWAFPNALESITINQTKQKLVKCTVGKLMSHLHAQKFFNLFLFFNHFVFELGFAATQRRHCFLHRASQGNANG